MIKYKLTVTKTKHKELRMIQRKSELNPTIVRRLQYQNKLGAISPNHRNQSSATLYQHSQSQAHKLHLKRSVSEPSSPRRIANFLKHGIKHRPSSKQIFDDDTQIDYNYAAMNNADEEVIIIPEGHEEEKEMKQIEMSMDTLPLPISTNYSKRTRDKNKRLKLENTASAPMHTPIKAEDLTVRAFQHRKHSSLDADDQTHSIPFSVLSVADDFISSQQNKKRKSGLFTKKSKNKNNEKKVDGDELLNGLNVLVLQGFYSRKGLNSVQQLRKYNKNPTQSKLYSIRE